MFMGVLSACMFVAWCPEEANGSPGPGVGCQPSCWESSWGPLKEQLMIITLSHLPSPYKSNPSWTPALEVFAQYCPKVSASSLQFYFLLGSFDCAAFELNVSVLEFDLARHWCFVCFLNMVHVFCPSVFKCLCWVLNLLYSWNLSFLKPIVFKFQGIVRHGGEVKAVVAWSGRLHCFHSEEAEN